MQPLTAWRPSREDWRGMLMVVLVPLLLALPQLTPWLKADPLYYTAGIAMDRGSVVQRGVPYVDPNNGFQTQALGHRAALDWVSGEVPWWNPYTGLGMPLAAEYQPAAFFPLTLLLLLPRGMVLLQMTLQVLAGLGTFCLLRQLGVSRLAATTGGIVYAMNGTLAWFAHGPAGVVPSLPWILLGIEHASVAASEGRRGGWRLLAIAMAMSLLAGFPETAYINGLLALAWALLRGVQAPKHTRLAYAGRIALGGGVALLVAVPQMASFFLYLREANIENHADNLGRAALHNPSVLTTLVAPYVFGPIFGYALKWGALWHFHGVMGGFVTAALITAALYGLVARHDALSWLLGTWFLSTIMKSFALEPFLTLWNLVPGVTISAFARYAHPSWELALILLAAFAIDVLQRDPPRRRALAIAALVPAIGLSLAFAYTRYLWGYMPADVGSLRTWVVAALAWATLSTAGVLVLIAAARRSRAVTGLAILLAAEATLFCALPILSNPRGGRLDVPAIQYLQANLGLQRFYTTGPIQPNYGAYFGIASINHNYLPVPHIWVEHIRRGLDRRWKEVSVFNGDDERNSKEELRTNIDAFMDAGVKYVVTYPHQDPLAGVDGVKQVYSDSIMRIFELPNPRAYFEATAGKCRVEAMGRTHARAQCDDASTLVRRELFYDGWEATVNGNEVPIEAAETVFQSIALPRGASEIRFSYSPPHIAWAWLAMGLGLAALVTPSLLLRRKHQ